MERKVIGIKRIIYEHISNNKKQYIIVALLFIIGIFLGVMFINNIQEEQKVEAKSYIDNFFSTMKSVKNINQINLLKTSLIQNILLAVALWFFGTTVIGIPIVFGIILYRGFCLGYTISILVTIMGMTKGLIFVLINLFLPSLLIIPAILALAVSGFKLYQSIVKNNCKENIKIEILRHTIFSAIMIVILILASLMEVFICTNILKWLIKYF